MMTTPSSPAAPLDPAAFLSRLEARGVALWLDEAGRLRYRAPAGTITPAVAARIKKARPRLLPLLRERAPLDALADACARDPFAADGDDPPHVVFTRALLDEAEAGALPVEPVTLPDGRTFADPNAAALDLARLCRLAAAVGRTEEAEGHARDLLALVAWWNEHLAALPSVELPAPMPEVAPSSPLPGYPLPPVVFADDVAGFWQRYDAEHGTHYAPYAKEPA